jgi:hypothetical protein
VPEVDVAHLPKPEEATSVVEAEMPVLEQLAGAWEQVDPAFANDPDFAPGGYSRSVIGIIGASGEMFVYRGFGPPEGPTAVFVSGQFAINLATGGIAVIGPSKLKPTTFPVTERRIPLSGGRSITITPPLSGVQSTTWDSGTEGGEPTLVIGGKRYRRASAAVYDAVVHGQPAAVDEVLNEQIRQAATAVGVAQASGAGGGGGAGTNVDFFGTKIRGRYVAFVIDNSGSMEQSGKIQAAITELRRTIAALPKDTNVYVVFFNSEAFELQSCNGWIRVGSGQVGVMTRDLAGVGAGGGTNPEPALRRAFGLGIRPDEIFFMTDGLMPPETAAVIAGLNGQSRARTRVHTFAFGPDADQAALQAIAGANDGQFRFIP